jgi:phage baseplate assembly protein W
MAVELPHFSFPFHLGGSGSFAVDEQDSADEVSAAVAICLATPLGSRAEVPEYGSPRAEFNLPPVGDLIEAVEEWEDRAALDIDVLRGLNGDETAVQLTAIVRPAIGGET